MNFKIIEDKIVQYTALHLTTADLDDDIARLEAEIVRIRAMRDELEVLEVIVPPQAKSSEHIPTK